MKIETYSYVFSGVNSEAYYTASVTDSVPIWAVAYGTETGSAKTQIHALEETAKKVHSISDSQIIDIFDHYHPIFQRTKAYVSVAGVFSDGKNFHLFNIGNARTLVFENGSLVMHTEDHSQAYMNYKSKKNNQNAAYDRIRNQENRLELWKVLGFGNDGKPQFYPLLPLKRNLALLICTETFWRYLSVIEMELDYRKSAGPEEWVKIMSRRVLMKSNRELDNDNFAVSAVMVEE